MEIAFLGVRAGNVKQVIAETNGLQKAVDLLDLLERDVVHSQRMC